MLSLLFQMHTDIAIAIASGPFCRFRRDATDAFQIIPGKGGNVCLLLRSSGINRFNPLMRLISPETVSISCCTCSDTLTLYTARFWPVCITLTASSALMSRLLRNNPAPGFTLRLNAAELMALCQAIR